MEYSVYDHVFQDYQYFNRQKEASLTVYQIKNETGMGELLCYDVFPGAQIIYNSLDMASCFQSVKTCPGFLQINHCREGCFEVELDGGMVGFIGEGDLAINDPYRQRIADSRLPLGRYNGITVLFELDYAQSSLEKLFPNAGIDLFQLRDKFCSGSEFFLLCARPEIEHIFSELYHVGQRIRETYMTLKVVELLLFLSLIKNEGRKCLNRFSRQVVDTTQSVCDYLLKNPYQKITVGEIAGKFNIAETNLRQCFKSIYGRPIGSFMRAECIRRSADLLRSHEELTVGQIALMVGYENQSKFAAAFRAVMGQTPLSYRHRMLCRNDELEQKYDV